MNSFSLDNRQYNAKNIRGEIKFDEVLARHTTWKVGGQAKIYYQPEDIIDLQNFFKLIEAKQHQILWLGLGSNVLIRDQGFNGIVINTVGKLKHINIYNRDSDFEEILAIQNTSKQESLMVSTECGVSCSKFSRAIATAELTGAEFFSGIPGSMGGAIAMNAGAFGGECWENLKFVETIDEQGNLTIKNKSEFEVSYRQVKGLKASSKGIREWFVKGFFSFSQAPEKVSETKAKIKKLLVERNQKQPVQYANAGSVFKNPKGEHAARLIEACGLKKYQIGGAMVSEKHANFIINQGTAKAKDIEDLIELIQQQVYQKFSINLQPEVKIHGQG